MRGSKSRELGCEMRNFMTTFAAVSFLFSCSPKPQNPPPNQNRRRRPLGPSGGLPWRGPSTGRPPIRLPGSGTHCPVSSGGAAAISSQRRCGLLRRHAWHRRLWGPDASASVLRAAAAAGLRAGGADVRWVSLEVFVFCFLRRERGEEEEERRRKEKKKLTLSLFLLSL